MARATETPPCSCGCGGSVPMGTRGRTNRFIPGHQRSRLVHGLSQTPTWYSWANMIARCVYPNNPAYRNYGGRGITVCPRWLGKNGFVNFLADMGERPEGLTLDRIDNDGNYELTNCRWATKSQQAVNRRTHGFASRTWRPFKVREEVN